MLVFWLAFLEIILSKEYRANASTVKCQHQKKANIQKYYANAQQ